MRIIPIVVSNSLLRREILSCSFDFWCTEGRSVTSEARMILMASEAGMIMLPILTSNFSLMLCQTPDFSIRLCNVLRLTISASNVPSRPHQAGHLLVLADERRRGGAALSFCSPSACRCTGFTECPRGGYPGR